VSWFEDLGEGPVFSVSFDVTQPAEIERSAEDTFKMQFYSPDFMVATGRALIIEVISKLFEETEAEKRRGQLLLQFRVRSRLSRPSRRTRGCRCSPLPDGLAISTSAITPTASLCSSRSSATSSRRHSHSIRQGSSSVSGRGEREKDRKKERERERKRERERGKE
jgi:hypothetical protein